MPSTTPGRLRDWRARPATPCHAVIYAAGQVKDLGPAGAKLSNAYDINDAGQVSGFALMNGTRRAILYANGVLTDIGTLGGTDADATGINAS
jgi:probable HAF family extracellular repeat protein